MENPVFLSFSLSQKNENKHREFKFPPFWCVAVSLENNWQTKSPFSSPEPPFLLVTWSEKQVVNDFLSLKTGGSGDENAEVFYRAESARNHIK